MGPEGWGILLTKLLDTVHGDGPDRYPVDVRSLALQYSAQRFPATPIKRVEGDDLDGFEGTLLPGETNTHLWGILYNAKQSPQRARFTVAHEFGHYLLHREVQPRGFWCGEDAIVRREVEGLEKEADTFAAYLLMPLHDFRARIPPDHKPTLEELGGCAERYGVSLTAAILRWLEYTHRRSLLVVSNEGYAHWAKASDPAYKSGRFIRTKGVLSGGRDRIPDASSPVRAMLQLTESERCMDNMEKKPRDDGRRPLLVYLDPELILALKVRALQEGTHVYVVVEDILKKSVSTGKERPRGRTSSKSLRGQST